MAQVQLTTDVKNFQRSEAISPASTAVPNKIITVTQPVTTAASSVIGSSLNYMKFKIHTSTTDALTVSIFGWSYASQFNCYVPQLLATLTTSQGGSTQTVPGTTVAQYEVTSYVLTSGDAKIYNSPATATAGAFILVDTLGTQFVETFVAGANEPTVYVWTSGL